MEYIRQSTGTTITVGPFVSLGGVTTVHDLVAGQVSGSGSGGTCKLHIGGTSTTITVSNWEHAGNGYYLMWFSGSSVSVVGSGLVSFTSTTPDFIPLWRDVFIQGASAHDSTVSGAYSGVTIGGVSLAYRVNDFTSNAKATLGGVTVAGASNVLTVGSVSSGVTINDFSPQAKSNLAGVTIGGVSLAYRINDFTSNAKATLGGVTVAGTSNVLTVGSISSGVTINDFSPQAKSNLAGVTVGGVSLAYRVNDFTSVAKATLGGVTVAGASNVLTVGSISSGVTINDFSSQAKGVLGGVTVAGVSKTYGITQSGVSNIFDGVIDLSGSSVFSLKEIIRIQNSAMFGLASGGGGVTSAFRDLADTKNRIDAVVDSDGNRTTISLDGT
jgi:hypothetical protein